MTGISSSIAPTSGILSVSISMLPSVAPIELPACKCTAIFSAFIASCSAML